MKIYETMNTSYNLYPKLARIFYTTKFNLNTHKQIKTQSQN